jgi:hypothetical protein
VASKTIKWRRDTAARWSVVNPTLASGEVGYETDAGKFKVGDDLTPWSSLPYYSGDGGGGGSAVGAVPIGGIIMWSGAIAAIPSPFALCDGTANAPGPDLRDKFVVGATQDAAGVAKTNIEGTLKVTGGVTGHSHSSHGDLVHVGMTISDHTGLTHSLAIADHPDLTHAALSHAAMTITQPPGVVPTFTGSHAAAGNVSVPSLAVAAATGSRPSLGVAATTGSRPSLPVAAVTGSRPSLAVASGADVSMPSQAIASGVDISAPSLTLASNAAISVPSQAIGSGVDVSMPSASFASNAAISVPSQAIASGADVSVPSGSIASNAAHSAPAQTITPPSSLVSVQTGTASRITIVGLQPTSAAPTIAVASAANLSAPSASVAAATASRPSLPVASLANASGPSGSIAAHTASRPSLAVAAVTGSRPSVPIASGVDISVPSQAIASGADVSIPSQAVASGVDVSVPSQAIASLANASAPSGSHSHASSNIAIPDISFPSLSHQDIGTHVGTDYGVHVITQPADHGVAGTLVHSFTEPSDHSISAHDTVLSLPNYYALAFIQRMAA